MPWSRVKPEYKHTPSTAYTEYSIHRVSYHPKIDCLSLSASLSADLVVLNSLHSHNYELTNEYSVSFHCTCLPIYCLQIHCLQIDCLQIDHLQVNCLQINRLQVLLQSWSIVAFKYISQQAQLRLPSTSLSSLDFGLQVYLQNLSITASKCISEFNQSLGLQVHLQTNSIQASKCISKYVWSLPPSASRWSDGSCTAIQRYQRWTEWWGVYIRQTPE